MNHYSPIGKHGMRPDLQSAGAGPRTAPGSAATLPRAALLVLTVVIGCDRSTAPQRTDRAGGSGLIVVFGPSSDQPEWVGVRGGAESLARRTPRFPVQCVAPHADSTDRPRSLLARTLEQGPQVVCLLVTDEAAARPLIDEAASAGAWLITIGAVIDDPRIHGSVAASLPDAAELLGASLEAVAAGRRSYVLVHASGADDLATKCYLRFAAVAERHPGLTLLKAVNTAEAGVDPAAAVEELLGLFPHAGLVVTLDPQVWLRPRANWFRELRDRNRDFRFATLSTAPPLWKHLGAGGGAAALVGPLHGELGAAAVQLAFELLLDAEQVVRQRRVPCEVVTPATLPEFARRYAEAAGGLDVTPYLPG